MCRSMDEKLVPMKSIERRENFVVKTAMRIKSNNEFILLIQIKQAQ